MENVEILVEPNIDDITIDVVQDTTNVTIEINNIGSEDDGIKIGDNISLLVNNVGYITDYIVTQLDVTQYESYLTITESQISDLNHFSPTSLLIDYGFTDNSINWNEAYSWGDHALVGYLTSADLTGYLQSGDNISELINDSGYITSSAIANFETTSQLNVRDTNNRDRANHTGTQLASTISDFAPKAIEAVTQPIKVSGSFTVTPAHNNCTIKVSGTTPTITFDPNTQAYPNKFSVYFLKKDTTDATFDFIAATGWTYTYDNLTLTGEGGRCGVLKFDGDNELILLGNE